ncbi:MAG TPA: TetR/AcrR family transcriptional regulator, partial [Phototrophicaceae bacterium]|nr:TetR/AcrR family transcriptional regulator [Phototrophicaceae bacterium]
MIEDVQDKRTAALKATLELISEQGFHGTPMSQIAQRANIGVGTIYRYFDNKEDLINALYLELKTRMVRSLIQSYSENLTVQEGFHQFLTATIHYLIEHPAELSFAEQYENSPLITATSREEASKIANPIQKLFERAIQQNLLKELPVEM